MPSCCTVTPPTVCPSCWGLWSLTLFSETLAQKGYGYSSDVSMGTRAGLNPLLELHIPLTSFMACSAIWAPREVIKTVCLLLSTYELLTVILQQAQSPLLPASLLPSETPSFGVSWYPFPLGFKWLLPKILGRTVSLSPGVSISLCPQGQLDNLKLWSGAQSHGMMFGFQINHDTLPTTGLIWALAWPDCCHIGQWELMRTAPTFDPTHPVSLNTMQGDLPDYLTFYLGREDKRNSLIVCH